MKDYMYYIGSSKSNNDCQLMTEFIINYIRINLDNGDDIARAIEAREHLDFQAIAPTLKPATTVPADPTKPTQAEKDAIALENRQFELEFNSRLRIHLQRVDKYSQNKVKTYGIMWQACSTSLQHKLEQRPEFDAKIKGDPIALVEAIEQHAVSYQENKYPHDVVLQAMRTLLSTRQKDDETLTDFTKRIKTNSDIL